MRTKKYKATKLMALEITAYCGSVENPKRKNKYKKVMYKMGVLKIKEI